MAYVLYAAEACCEGKIPQGSYLIWNAEGFNVVTREHLDCGAVGMAWMDGKLELIPEQEGFASLEAARLVRLCAGLPIGPVPVAAAPTPRAPARIRLVP